MSFALASLLFMPMTPTVTPHVITEHPRVVSAKEHVQEELGEYFGAPVFIRIIKEDRELELWVQDNDGDWSVLKTYRIAGMSGKLGPKTKEGDRQAPEGFYRVTPRHLNPNSNYHLGINVGYPNPYDRALHRTGGLIMIHGSHVSIGCFAVTDSKVEEIYTLINEAFKAGVKEIPIQIYPFHMTEDRMEEEVDNEHYEFWQHLLPGYQYTEDQEAPYPDTDFKKPEKNKSCETKKDSV